MIKHLPALGVVKFHQFDAYIYTRVGHKMQTFFITENQPFYYLATDVQMHILSQKKAVASIHSPPT